VSAAADGHSSGQQQTNEHQLSNPIQQQQQQQQQQNQQQQQQQNQQPPYTIPGILHYLQFEWHRFEVERQEWEVEKAELSARIALLQGEKKSHENLRHDLIRRIKMLEYCLRMERAKYHRLKHGAEPPPIECANSSDNSSQQQQDGENSSPSDKAQQQQQIDDGFIGTNNSSTITYGRELLKHYLQEIGYTDTIIDLRSNRVRSLLGIVDQNQLSDDSNQQTNNQSNTNATNDINRANNIDTNKMEKNARNSNQAAVAAVSNRNADTTKGSPFSSRLTNNSGSRQPGAQNDDAESSVLATFGFLYDNESKDSSNMEESDEEDVPDEAAIDAADRAASTREGDCTYFEYIEREKRRNESKQKLDLLNNGKAQPSPWESGLDHQRDRLVPGSEQAQPDVSSTTTNPATSTNAKNAWCPTNTQKSDVVDIGELATLTTLGSEPSAEHDSRKKQWTNKYRLQSHYDCVRALKFSEKDSLIVTASEDETIKLWHLSRPSSAGSKSRQPSLPPSMNAISSLEGSTLDIEPLHTYRGHTSRILAITTHQDHIFSGAQNGELIMWKIIPDPSTADQYDKFDSSLLVCRFAGHDDAIWSLEVVDHTKSESLLCSASADLTLKIWSILGDKREPLKIINLESSPTCLARMPLYNVYQANADIAVSSCDGKIRLYDLTAAMADSTNTQQPTAILECDDSHRINSIVIHPTLPYLASADSNRSIKFWDLKTNKCKLTMVAHLDEVTSLACDPTGKYLLSASHDCSARLWLFEEKSCIQEITSHRKKFDEGIFAVAFHPNQSHFATAGADGLAKVFV
jgi:striatin 1/3/4